MALNIRELLSRSVYIIFSLTAILKINIPIYLLIFLQRIINFRDKIVQEYLHYLLTFFNLNRKTILRGT